MNDNNLTCISCGGNFSLTNYGKEIFEANNLSNPKHCLQCSIIIARNKGENPKNINTLVKTNSTFWTEDKISEYNDKLKEANNELYSNMQKRHRKRY